MFCTCIEKTMDRCIWKHKGCKILTSLLCIASRSFHSPAVSVLKPSCAGACFSLLWSRPLPAQPRPGHCLSPVLLQGENKSDIFFICHKDQATETHQSCKAWQISKKKIHRVRTRILRGFGYFFNDFTPYHQWCQLWSPGLHWKPELYQPQLLHIKQVRHWSSAGPGQYVFMSVLLSLYRCFQS